VATCGGLFAGQVICEEPMQREIVVTAVRQSDAALATEVAIALGQDPYIFSDHLTVTASNGVVRVGGLVREQSDLLAILRLARRIAGKGRVVNEIQFDPVDDDGN
jgi:osmotically-inducible protein OsmY